MTCYMRHLGDVFEALGLENDKPTRDRVDRAIRDALDVPDGARCPEVWSAVKAVPRDELMAAVAAQLGLAHG